MIKELNLKLPEGADVVVPCWRLRAAGISPYKMDWTVLMQEEYREDWDKFNFGI